MGHVLHTHPQREKDCKLDIEHVIVDRNEFDNAKVLLEAADGKTIEQAAKYLEHGAEMVYDKEWMRDYLKEIIEQGRGYECACIMLEKALTKSLAKLEATS